MDCQSQSETFLWIDLTRLRQRPNRQTTCVPPDECTSPCHVHTEYISTPVAGYHLHHSLPIPLFSPPEGLTRADLGVGHGRFNPHRTTPTRVSCAHRWTDPTLDLSTPILRWSPNVRKRTTRKCIAATHSGPSCGCTEYIFLGEDYASVTYVFSRSPLLPSSSLEIFDYTEGAGRPGQETNGPTPRSDSLSIIKQATRLPRRMVYSVEITHPLNTYISVSSFLFMVMYVVQLVQGDWGKTRARLAPRHDLLGIII